ncbi:MAG: hypothetical protein NTZ39_00375 [Methanoregula sp.]|nr:hypothetical protein [Methanoregula sp.]
MADDRAARMDEGVRRMRRGRQSTAALTPEDADARSWEVLREEQDLPGIILQKGQSPVMIFLPSCDFSHIPGGLDLVASYAEDLKIIPGPLIPAHGDWSDVIQDIVMEYMQTLGGFEFMDLLFAMSALPFLFIMDKLPHFGNCGPLFAPILGTAGGPAADGIHVPKIEV